MQDDIYRCITYFTYFIYFRSADGLLLVSQGGDPDFTITLWNWQKSEIALKCKSYNHDIYNVTISPSLAGYLTTSGSGHIKFWKLSKTFTGLKLKGEIGKFGQTEICDIVGIYIMPDGKVNIAQIYPDFLTNLEWLDLFRIILFLGCIRLRMGKHFTMGRRFNYS